MRTQFVGDTENAINKYFKNIVNMETMKHKLAQIFSFDWWYPEFEMQGNYQACYKIALRLKYSEKNEQEVIDFFKEKHWCYTDLEMDGEKLIGINFDGVEEFNKFFGTQFEKMGSYEIMEQVILKCNPKAKVMQSEFDCS